MLKSTIKQLEHCLMADELLTDQDQCITAIRYEKDGGWNAIITDIDRSGTEAGGSPDYTVPLAYVPGALLKNMAGYIFGRDMDKAFEQLNVPAEVAGQITASCPSCYQDFVEGYIVCETCGHDLPFFANVPQEVWEELRIEIARNDLDCVSSLRAYRYSDRLYQTMFDHSAANDCCGVFQSHIIISNGEKWIVGCNYGH